MASYAKWFAKQHEVLARTLEGIGASPAHFPRSATYKGQNQAWQHASQCQLDACSSLGFVCILAALVSPRQIKIDQQQSLARVLQQALDKARHLNKSSAAHESLL